MSATDALLKNGSAQPPPAYGTAGSSSQLEAGNTSSSVTAEPSSSEGFFGPRTKQFVAGGAILFSGGMKVAELVITRSWGWHDPYEPIRGMVIIGWALVYMLQVDYVYMLGHTPTETDPAGYAAARALASSKIYKFVAAHILLGLWQLFHILDISIAALVSISLAFAILANMYWQLHQVRANKLRQPTTGSSMTTSAERHNTLAPSFVQGPISSLLIITATIWLPDAIIDVVLWRLGRLESVTWPLACWLLFVNFLGSHISTRMGYISNKRHEANSAFRAAAAQANGEPAPTAVGTDQRMVPVDLAGVLGLFWASLAIAAGPGTVNYGPVAVVAYLGAAWQALAIIGAII